jgi:hypothetical protein
MMKNKPTSDGEKAPISNDNVCPFNPKNINGIQDIQLIRNVSITNSKIEFF